MPVNCKFVHDCVKWASTENWKRKSHSINVKNNMSLFNLKDFVKHALRLASALFVHLFGNLTLHVMVCFVSHEKRTCVTFIKANKINQCIRTLSSKLIFQFNIRELRFVAKQWRASENEGLCFAVNKGCLVLFKSEWRIPDTLDYRL